MKESLPDSATAHSPSLRYRVLALVLPLLFLASCASPPREYYVDLNQPARQAEALAKEGDYEASLSNLKEALRIYTAETNDMGRLYCLERTGWLQRESGAYGAALETLRKAHQLGVALNGDAAEIDAGLGDVYMFSGDTERARKHFEKALSTLNDFVFPTSYSRPPSKELLSTLVRKSKALIHAHVNIGLMHYFNSDFAAAAPHLAEAEKLIKRIESVHTHFFYRWFITMPSDFFQGAGYFHSVSGAILGEQKKYDDAFRHYALADKAFDKAHVAYAKLVSSALRLRTLLLASNMQATEMLRRESSLFLEQAEALGAYDLIWRVNHGIGQTLRGADQHEEALPFLIRAIDVLELTRSELREDTVKQMFAASVNDVYRDTIDTCFETGEFEQGFDYLERAKGRAFLDLLAGRTVRATATVAPALVARKKTIQEQLDTLSRQFKIVSEKERPALTEKHRKLMDERRELLEQIKSQSLKYAATESVATVPAKRLASRLNDHTALLSFFSTPDRTIVWVIRNTGVYAVSTDIGSEDLDTLAMKFRKATVTSWKKRVNETGPRLTEALILSAEKHLEGVTDIMLVPSRSLHYMPFACLPTGKDRYLVHDYALSILPNASSLLYTETPSRTRSSLYAIGNPAREGRDVSLPGAEKEVRAIASRFNTRTLLFGKKATETAFLSADFDGVSVIHLAAHGKYNSDEPMSSSLLLAPDSANDGNLETIDIFSMQFEPRLVVLSACESGLGKVGGGDEVQSMTRAFTYAGAGGVVASLWRVPDESTLSLMKAFYSRLNGMTAARALKEAQLSLLKDFPDPYEWAAFYLTGSTKL